jgi:electron transfer flavoprotein alpha subunit
MKILAIAEQRNNQFKRTAFEVVGTARRLADELGATMSALVIGSDSASIAPQLEASGASHIIVADHPKLIAYSPTAYARVVAEIAKTEQAEVVLFSASSMGRDVSPRVAAKLEAGLAADCIALWYDNGNLTATRPVYAGKGLLDVTINSAVKIFTLRPNVFPVGTPAGSAARVDKRTIELCDADFAAAVRETIAAGQKKDVTEADVVVSGGRGMKGPEHFAMLEALAAPLNAAIGASRAVVDAGWRPHEEQVGQTGKTVSPSLYIAVGISGAVQHLAGMSSSKCIIAINKDKDAPIFSVADYGIVGDAFEIVPAMTQEIKKLLAR